MGPRARWQRDWAKAAADKLQDTLDEEGEADRKLSAIAESEVNPEAAASSRKAR